MASQKNTSCAECAHPRSGAKEYKLQCPNCEIVYNFSYARFYAIKKIGPGWQCRKCSEKQRTRTDFTRPCPSCGDILQYSCYGYWWKANKENSTCRKCAHAARRKDRIRKCPRCTREIRYISKSAYVKANKKGTLCGPCRLEVKELKIAEQLKSYRCPNCNEPILYTVLSSLQSAQYHKSRCGKCSRLLRIVTDEHKEQARKQLAKVSNKRPPYDIWLEKFGKKEADRRMQKLRENHSANTRGENNPMFGRPVPKGAGNGWKGWYKCTFFRSLLELSFMVELDTKKISWQVAEKIEIDYTTPLGEKGTYRPDFIVENKEMIECKPKRLWNTPLVLAKAKGAHLYCKEHKLAYRIVEPEKLGFDQIRHLWLDSSIKFLPEYEKRFIVLDRKNTRLSCQGKTLYAKAA